MKAVLKISILGEHFEQGIGVGTHVVLGRSTAAQCQIKDEKISSTHCKFYFQRDSMVLTDLDSKNGTYLNGIRIEKSEVFIGDEIKIGDTVISFADGSMDEESTKALTFPGKNRDRMNYELKVDFTGARLQNQIYDHANTTENNQTQAHAREIEIRNKMKGEFKISKQEIRKRNAIKSNLASVIDLICLTIVAALPIFVRDLIFRISTEHFQEYSPTVIIILAEFTLVTIFTLINLKIMKFTVGEQLSGIKRLYFTQEEI